MKKLFHLLLAVGLGLIVSMCSTTSPEEEQDYAEALLGNEKVTVDPVSMEQELLDLVNDHRASIGEVVLQDSPSSYKYAEEHNQYMISKNKLSHDNFDDRATQIAAETDAVSVSENVARYYSSAEVIMEAWLNSSSHREAMEGDFTHTTLSVQLDKDGRPYYTQIFLKVE
ncbi:CAP domain-containing protein [Muricauda sp. CAU 1633]|uniref:CAP domain-containing protein n=1 Tax=Allomuricauda sp. CAU 1633 TaxID=2816036 RepID=UPI001A8CCA70|nr:CAP domain-containing protein [Muricauda sp. CAU 1633]MBO0321164.1 CAP domain-containing protein [Muricauda sp. CAU 1633]